MLFFNPRVPGFKFGGGHGSIYKPLKTEEMKCAIGFGKDLLFARANCSIKIKKSILNLKYFRGNINFIFIYIK